MNTKPLPPETIEAGRIAELVEQIESAVRLRDFYWKLADSRSADVMRHSFNAIAARYDHHAEELRAAIRALIGCDPYRLASAIGA